MRAELFGPSGSIVVRLALDTGATGTTVNAGLLNAIGYDPALVPDRVQLTTGSAVEYAPRLPVNKIEALGQERVNFLVVAHTLPPTASVFPKDPYSEEDFDLSEKEKFTFGLRGDVDVTKLSFLLMRHRKDHRAYIGEDL